MKSGLYRIEVFSNLLRNNPPKDDNCAMITDNDGITFAKLHRVSINAKPQKKDLGPCIVCRIMENEHITVPVPTGGTITERVRFCPLCGRYLYGEEAQE